MPIYVFIILFFIATFLGCEKKYFSELSYFMILAVLCILPLLVGINSDRADFNNYLLFFQESPTSIFLTEFYNYVEQQHAEIGYNYFQAIVKFFVNSATFFFIVFCFLSLFTRYKYYRYLMSLSDLAIAMFAFFSHEFLRKDCVQIRNGMASAIVLFALIFLFQNKKIKFLFFVLLASTFHVIALAALPLIFIQLNFSKRNVHFLLFIFLVSLCLSIFFPLKKLLIVSASFLPSRLSVYIDWADYLVAMPFIHPILLKQVFITVFIFFRYKKLFTNRIIYFLFKVYLISTCYYLIFHDFEIIAARLGSLFHGVEAPLLIFIINNSNKNTIIKKCLLCLFYLMFLFLNMLTFDFLGFHVQIY